MFYLQGIVSVFLRFQSISGERHYEIGIELNDLMRIDFKNRDGNI